jgi:molybdopterin converting factor small subunit
MGCAGIRIAPKDRAFFIKPQIAARRIMKISVKSYHELKSFTAGLPDGGQMELVPGDTVQTVLTRLAVSSQKLPGLVLFVNGRLARLETLLQTGDTLIFFSSLSGG